MPLFLRLNPSAGQRGNLLLGGARFPRNHPFRPPAPRMKAMSVIQRRGVKTAAVKKKRARIRKQRRPTKRAPKRVSKTARAVGVAKRLGQGVRASLSKHARSVLQKGKDTLSQLGNARKMRRTVGRVGSKVLERMMTQVAGPAEGMMSQVAAPAEKVPQRGRKRPANTALSSTAKRTRRVGKIARTPLSFRGKHVIRGGIGTKQPTLF